MTVLRWWQIPHDDVILETSVAPTLQGGDWVLLWRLTEPGLGSLVLCPDPEDPGNVVIGRIAAEEDDTITIDGHSVRINHQLIRTESACDSVYVEDPNTHNQVELHCDVEALGGTTHMRATAVLPRTVHREFKSTVGPARVFLLSDNRVYPFDSRHYGNVLRDTCKESIFFRLWGSDGFGNEQRRFTYIR